MIAGAATLAAFLRARRRMNRLDSEAKIRAYGDRRLAHFLKAIAPRVPAYSGMSLKTLADAPVISKADVMARFENYNRLGLTAAQGWDVFEGRAAAPKGHAVGASTGTSGNRGLYVVSAWERYTWLGVILSRALPNFLKERPRVAVILPQSSQLYDAANESQRLSLKFYDLKGGLERQMPAIADYAPDVLVGPPRVLRALAEADLPQSPRHVFSGAEVMDPADRAIIEARFGLTVREIYMATEGLFAVACDHGKMHLLEDHVAFEWEDKGDGLHAPIVTDFTRRTQVMLRYRMNDLVRLGARNCACGSAFQIIEEIVGRQDDAFELQGADGTVLVTPDIIRNTVLDADRAITDYRVTQCGPRAVRLELPSGQEALLDMVGAGLTRLFNGLGADPTIELSARRFDDIGPAKLRRVVVAKGAGA